MVSVSARETLEKNYSSLIEVNPDLNRQLVSFQANKKIPFYGWFPYKEGFSAQMVKMFLSGVKSEGKTVIDPFAGICTTLFAANELGFESTGIELLPIGEFIYKSRVSANKVDFDLL